MVDQLTIDEQIGLMAGAGFWETAAIDRLGIPAVKVSDGPNGARGSGGFTNGVPAASFPVGISLASTWNLDVARQFGEALAAEVKTKRAQVVLGPTINVHRSPLGGRNFESFSEDPYLAGEIGAVIVNALQANGIAACVKHFTGNESEFERNTINSVMDERTLREIYLRPFEIVARKAKPWSVMTAYNQLNGTFCCQNPRLLQAILRKEWGFDGMTMSDWVGTKTTVEAANAGLDLEMPGPTRVRGAQLRAAVDAGEVSRTAVRTSAANVLRLADRVDIRNNPSSNDEQAVDLPEIRALIRAAGAQGIVLLKNDGVLPLEKTAIKSVAAIGPNADVAQIMGGGSSQINAHYRVSPLAGIDTALGTGSDVNYAQGCTNTRLLPTIDGEVKYEFFAGRELAGNPVLVKNGTNSEDLWLGFVDPKVPFDNFSVRSSTTFTPDRTAAYEFSAVCSGATTITVDGKTVVDYQNWEAGGEFFGLVSKEIRGSIDLVGGKTVTVITETAPDPMSFGVREIRTGAGRESGDDEIEEAVQLASHSDVAVVFVGLNGQWDTEGMDRPHMDLPGRQNELVERVAAVNANTIVVIQSGGPVHLPWLDNVKAVLQAWYPGQECGNAISDVLFGDIAPSGRLPQSWPARLEQNPSWHSYPGARGAVEYTEGLFVGYRHYTSAQVPTLYPFGYGLTYTDFAYSELSVSASDIAPGENNHRHVADPERWRTSRCGSGAALCPRC